jgi:hypothetical protein
MNAGQVNTLGGVCELLGVVAVVGAWSMSPATAAFPHGSWIEADDGNPGYGLDLGEAERYWTGE